MKYTKMKTYRPPCEAQLFLSGWRQKSDVMQYTQHNSIESSLLFKDIFRPVLLTIWAQILKTSFFSLHKVKMGRDVLRDGHTSPQTPPKSLCGYSVTEGQNNCWPKAALYSSEQSSKGMNNIDTLLTGGCHALLCSTDIKRSFLRSVWRLLKEAAVSLRLKVKYNLFFFCQHNVQRSLYTNLYGFNRMSFHSWMVFCLLQHTK